MIKQSFPFNELLARKEFENANTCKHKSFLTNKLKEELFVFSNALKTRQLVIFIKISLFSSKHSTTTKQTFFQKRFFIVYKTLKTMEMTNLEIYKL